MKGGNAREHDEIFDFHQLQEILAPHSCPNTRSFGSRGGCSDRDLNYNLGFIEQSGVPHTSLQSECLPTEVPRGASQVKSDSVPVD